MTPSAVPSEIAPFEWLRCSDEEEPAIRAPLPLSSLGRTGWVQVPPRCSPRSRVTLVMERLVHVQHPIRPGPFANEHAWLVRRRSLLVARDGQESRRHQHAQAQQLMTAGGSERCLAQGASIS